MKKVSFILLLEFAQPSTECAFFVPARGFIANDCGDPVDLSGARKKQRNRKGD